MVFAIFARLRSEAEFDMHVFYWSTKQPTTKKVINKNHRKNRNPIHLRDYERDANRFVKSQVNDSVKFTEGTKITASLSVRTARLFVFINRKFLTIHLLHYELYNEATNHHVHDFSNRFHFNFLPWLPSSSLLVYLKITDYSIILLILVDK